LAPSAACDAIVKFTPVSSGPASGTFSVGFSGGTATAPLAGTGLLAPVLALSAPSIDFGTLTLGGPTAVFPLGLRNSGNAALTIDSITVSSPFTLTHDCPLNLLPNDTCVVTVALTPTELGTFTGSLALLTNAPGGSRSVPVRASVQPRPEPIIRVTPTSIGFGERLGGTQSPSQRVTVTNEGGADAAGLAVSINTPHFVVLNSSCGPVLAPQSTCFADVAFQPIGFGPKRATLSVSSTAPTATVSLSGAGCRPPQANPGRSGRPNCAP
ncbi:MAG TPA: choice-of-anchor D domain-containing protein, partial [Gemmatimonadales bacterium]|nr:choice-of-anchor D domain-containing protein [Gemmatimonadales bacterium]